MVPIGCYLDKLSGFQYLALYSPRATVIETVFINLNMGNWRSRKTGISMTYHACSIAVLIYGFMNAFLEALPPSQNT